MLIQLLNVPNPLGFVIGSQEIFNLCFFRLISVPPVRPSFFQGILLDVKEEIIMSANLFVLMVLIVNVAATCGTGGGGY